MKVRRYLPCWRLKITFISPATRRRTRDADIGLDRATTRGLRTTVPPPGPRRSPRARWDPERGAGAVRLDVNQCRRGQFAAESACRIGLCAKPWGTVSPPDAPSWLTAEPRRTARIGSRRPRRRTAASGQACRNPRHARTRRRRRRTPCSGHREPSCPTWRSRRTALERGSGSLRRPEQRALTIRRLWHASGWRSATRSMPCPRPSPAPEPEQIRDAAPRRVVALRWEVHVEVRRSASLSLRVVARL